jgi:hypothetical protein
MEAWPFMLFIILNNNCSFMNNLFATNIDVKLCRVRQRRNYAKNVCIIFLKALPSSSASFRPAGVHTAAAVLEPKCLARCVGESPVDASGELTEEDGVVQWVVPEELGKHARAFMSSSDERRCAYWRGRSGRRWHTINARRRRWCRGAAQPRHEGLHGA